MECGRRLIVFKTADYATVYYYLMIVQLPPHHSERVVLRVVVYVDLGQAGTGARGDPAFEAVVVDHDGRARAAY